MAESKEIKGVVEVNVVVPVFLRHWKQSLSASLRSRCRGWIPWSGAGEGAAPPGELL